MSSDESIKLGRGKRSETVTVRLDPKLRYLAELAAAKHRRTLSSFIEWAIEDSLHRVKLREGTGYNNDEGTTISEEAESLWDVDDADRFAKLAFKYPELLTHEEQKRWKIIRENGLLWQGDYSANNKWKWKVREEGLILERLRQHWDLFCAVARGEKNPSVLPAVADKNETEQTTAPHTTVETTDFDDDIPF
jgi:predicted transcriptional regulator